MHTERIQNADEKILDCKIAGELIYPDQCNTCICLEPAGMVLCTAVYCSSWKIFPRNQEMAYIYNTDVPSMKNV